MFWYPSGPIFKSNFQNGAKHKPEKEKKLNIDTVIVVNVLELQQDFDV